MKMTYIKTPNLAEKKNKGSTQFYLQFCLLSYTTLDCLLENHVSHVVKLTSHHLEMGSYPLKVLLPVYYYYFFVLFH